MFIRQDYVIAHFESSLAETHMLLSQQVSPLGCDLRPTTYDHEISRLSFAVPNRLHLPISLAVTSSILCDVL